jgi:hypothetical protein
VNESNLRHFVTTHESVTMKPPVQLIYTYKKQNK